MNWTDDQKKVIDTRNSSILVSAAAGSGKTAVLVARILELIRDPEKPVNIDELLIVTFTRAAAAEMKTRIEAAISNARAEAPDDLHLAKQAALVHNAQITTIDGFCTYVIRNYGYTIGLVPGFRVADEGEIRLLKRDVVREVLEQAYAEAAELSSADTELQFREDAPVGGRETGQVVQISGENAGAENARAEEDRLDPEAFLTFVETFAEGKTDTSLEDAILRVCEAAVSDPDPEGWLSDCRAMNRAMPGEDSDSSMQEYLADAKAEIEMALTLAKLNLELAQRPDGPSGYENTARADLEIVSKLAASTKYDAIRSALGEALFGRLSSAKAKAGEDPSLRDVFKSNRDSIKKTVGELQERYFPCSSEDAKEIMLRASIPLDALLLLSKRFLAHFAEVKEKKNLMDFSDIEHAALRVLRGRDGRTEAAKELAAHYAEVMVDEYQDSNYLQEAILTAVSRIEDGTGNYFCVGDVKQSIYRFRQARPELFMEKFRTYRERPGTGTRIDLHMNFRSCPEVIDSVNAVFREIMFEEIGGIDYDDDAALITGVDHAPDRNSVTELMPVYYGEEDASGEAFLEDHRRSAKTDAEIRAIGTRIRAMVGYEKIRDGQTGEARPVEYRDIVILVRAAKGFSERAVRILEEMQIPAYSETKTGYFNAMEVQTVLSFLEIVDNPQQDIPFAGVLRSAFCGLSVKQLAMIRAAAREKEQNLGGACSLWDAARICAEESGDEGLRSRLGAFFTWYDELRDAVPDTPLHELVDRIITESGYRDYAAALPGGAQRAVNLRMLVDQAAGYEHTSYIGLFNFVRYIRNLEKQDYDLGELGTISENENVVRIYTTHKSKGLEFPVVFAANLDRLFNRREHTGALLIHSSCGIASNYTDLQNRVKIPTIRARLLSSRLRRDAVGEELRVLYVAMTRAKQKLILSGCIKNEEALREAVPLSDLRAPHLPEGFVLKAASPLIWLIAAQDRLARKAKKNGTQELIVLKPVNPSELAQAEVGAAIRKEDVLEKLRTLRPDEVRDPGIRRLIDERFSYRYPYAGRENIPVELSVSAIKKRVYDAVKEAERNESESILEEAWQMFPDEELGEAQEEELFEVPEFIKEREARRESAGGGSLEDCGSEGSDPRESTFVGGAVGKQRLTGASRGTAYHNLMELLDFAAFDGLSEAELLSGIEREKERGLSSGKLSDDEAACIRNRDIADFLRSTLGQRMIRAAKRSTLFREQPFVMAVKASALREDWPADEEVFIQGICDAYFIENDRIILMDYKTDRVRSEEELTAHYTIQLQLYRDALERAVGTPVGEILIWSFALGRQIGIPV